MHTWWTEFDGSVFGDNDNAPGPDSMNTAGTGLVVRHIECGVVDTRHMIESSVRQQAWALIETPVCEENPARDLSSLVRL